MDAFNSIKDSVLKEKFRLADRHIVFLRESREQYNKLMVDVLDAERWAGIQEREDIIK